MGQRGLREKWSRGAWVRGWLREKWGRGAWVRGGGGRSGIEGHGSEGVEGEVG